MTQPRRIVLIMVITIQHSIQLHTYVMLTKSQTPIQAWATASSQFGCKYLSTFSEFSLVEPVVILSVQFWVHSISLVLQVCDRKHT